jgi:YVTN family beta-propeller protein
VRQHSVIEPAPIEELRRRVRRRHQRRHLLALAAPTLTAVVAIGGVLFIAGQPSGRDRIIVGSLPSPTTAATPTTATLSAPSTIVPTVPSAAPHPVRVSAISLNGATDVAIGAGGVWVPGLGVLHRLDPQSGRIVATIPVRGSSDLRSVAVGGGAVWVTDSGTQTVTRVDPRNNTVVASIPVGGAPAGIAYGFGIVWVVNQQGLSVGAAVQTIDPTTNRVGAPIPVFQAGSLTIGATAVWVNGGLSGLHRLDPRTHAISTVTLPGYIDPTTGLATPVALVGTGEDIWLLGVASLQRADPVTADPVGPRLDISTGPVGVTPQALWIVQQPDNTKPSVLQEVDPTLLRPVGKPIAVGLTAVAVAATPQSVWVANFNAGSISKIDLAS